MNENKTIGTLADVLSPSTRRCYRHRRRDMISAINRICEMAGSTPGARAEPPVLRRCSLASVRRPRGQRQELLEPEEPSGCCT
jgi:hypothetical protein